MMSKTSAAEFIKTVPAGANKSLNPALLARIGLNPAVREEGTNPQESVYGTPEFIRRWGI